MQEDQRKKDRYLIKKRKHASYTGIRLASMVEISATDLKKLIRYRDELGFLPHEVLKRSQDVPNGVTSELISTWVNKQTAKADPELLQWILNRCRELEKFSKK